ncbi:TetR/AcrR family transcriptional regulator [Acetobacter sp. DsW_063]|uniref:TetR/AcrR family transcriptional regulator n=1 Tax=Acetobacter sp. DsW_063 TaxID=1514894 RepID=UPI001E56C660|nr:TetR/AcrR family transcriptional regulator [Acetobacter sp. DsW_063]
MRRDRDDEGSMVESGAHSDEPPLASIVVGSEQSHGEVSTAVLAEKGCVAAKGGESADFFPEGGSSMGVSSGNVRAAGASSVGGAHVVRRGGRVLAGDKIRETAASLFYARGIRSVGVDEIVRAAQVTKPSLYRAYKCKDDLAELFLRDYLCDFIDRMAGFEAVYPDDPRAQIIAYFDDLTKRSVRPEYRGCALSNALLEYTESDHPVRRRAQDLKQDIRAWMAAKCRELKVADPETLADRLLLLLEGVYGAGQAFVQPGPAAQAAALARLVLDAAGCPAP